MIAERALRSPSLNSQKGASALAPAADLTGMLIQADSQAAESARAVNARAYATGRTLCSRPGDTKPLSAN
jgi:hypothetical protein